MKLVWQTGITLTARCAVCVSRYRGLFRRGLHQSREMPAVKKTEDEFNWNGAVKEDWKKLTLNQYHRYYAWHCIRPGTTLTTSSSVTEKHDPQRSQNFTICKATVNSGQQCRTLVVLFGFYGASERAISNYCALYHKYGFDAVYVKSFLKHFAWPKNSIELADDVLSFIEKNCANYDKIVIHAFSMGAYNFTVCMGDMYENPERFSNILSRIKATVYDSLTVGSLKNMAVGVGLGISKNPLVQMVVPLTMSLYFKLTYKYTVKLYDHFIDIFKQKPLQVPTLLYCCKNDPMSDFSVIHEMTEDWRRRFDFDLLCKSWDRSKHSAHLLQHKEDYTQTLDAFLRSVPGLLSIDSKL